MAQASKLSNITPILDEYMSLVEQIRALTKRKDVVKKQVLDMFSANIQAGLREKEEPFGTVNIQEGEYQIKTVTPKKVEYDQVGMEKLYKEGAPVTVEYTLSETLFKAMGDASRSEFLPYRTVKPGSVSLEITRGEG